MKKLKSLVFKYRFVLVSLCIIGLISYSFLEVVSSSNGVQKKHLSYDEVHAVLPDLKQDGSSKGYHLTEEQFKQFVSLSRKSTLDNSAGKSEYIAQLAAQIKQNTYSDKYSQALVTPENGGILTAGNIKVTFPKGAVGEPLIITFKLFDKYSKGNNKIYKLDANDIYGASVHKFNKEITIETTLSKVPSKKDIKYSYLNEDKLNWVNVATTYKNNKVIANTNHFSIWSEGDGSQLSYKGVDLTGKVNGGDYSNCPNAIDDSNQIGCYEKVGIWDQQDSGYNKTSFYTNSASTYAYYFTNYKDLKGKMPIYITIPSVPAGPKGAYTLSNKAYYFVLDKNGINAVGVDLEADEGKTISLGEYDFDGSTAGVAIYGLEHQDLWGYSFIISDRVCFGSCGAGSESFDLVPPDIKNVQYGMDGNNFYIQADVTDVGSGVDKVVLTFNGKEYVMNKQGNTYSMVVPYTSGENLSYFITASDNYGNKSKWKPGFGDAERGVNSWIGIPDFLKNFLHHKQNYLGKTTAAVAGVDKCSPCAGDPVDTQNGNLLEKIGLLKINSRPDINFNLYYNSQSSGMSIFGEGWSHEYNYKLTTMDNADFKGAFLTYPDGHLVTFTGDNLTPDNGVLDKLVKVGDQYILFKPDLTKVTFDSYGDAVRIEDKNANGLSLEYSEQTKLDLSKLSKIKTDGGIEITFEYNDMGLVSQINAPENKQIKFEYSSEDDLILITDPKDGQIKFEYQDHNLIRKISPEGYAYYTNTYDAKRRVTSQIAGDSFVQEYLYEANETEVKDANGTTAKYFFNNDGLMTGNTDEAGNTTSFAYNANKLLSSETDAEGNKYEYQYDQNGNQTYEKDPKGNETKRIFNDKNEVTAEQNKVEDHTTLFDYDSKGNLIKVTDANAKASEFKYDAAGDLTYSTDANGNTTKLSYDNNGNLTKVVDPLGNSQIFFYDNLGRKVAAINAKGNATGFIYDKNDNLIEVHAELGFTNKFAYDKNNRLIAQTDANGNSAKYSYNNSEDIVSVTDALGNVSKSTYGKMNEKLQDIDPNGTVTSYSYASNYKPLTQTGALGTSVQSKYSYTFTKDNQLTSVIDPLGLVTTFQYDSLGQLVKVLNPANKSKANTFDAVGNVTSSTDENGHKTEYTYDKLDRLTSQKDAKGNVIKYEYDSNGNLIKSVDAKGNESNYTYDKANRLVETQNAKGKTQNVSYDQNGNVASVIDENGNKTSYEYDALDRLIKIQNPKSEIRTLEYDLVGNVVASTDFGGNITKYAYDALNRNISTTDALGKVTKLDYDKVGNLIKVTDRNGNATTYEYDPLNRQIKSTNAENATTASQYDADGNLTAQVDPKGANTKYAYDELGNLVKQINALNKVTSYSYDNVGNLLTQTDANGNSVKYAYDPVYNLTKEIDQEGFATSFAYDQNKNLIEKVDANGNKYGYAYDELNRLNKIQDPKSKVQSLNYDNVGNLVSHGDQNGNTTKYSYDKLYNLTKQTDAEGNATKFTYDANGNNTEVVDANGNPTNNAFDALNRLTATTNAENETTKYAYDNEGNKLNEIAPNNVATGYNYDKIYRLKSVDLNSNSGKAGSDSNVATTYAYDPNDNLTQITDPNGHATKFSYDALNRQIKEINALGNAWNYAYDAVGNQIKRVDANGAVTSYSYYPDNQLKKTSYQSSVISYQYDPNNNQVSMNDSLGTSSWTFDALNRVTSATNSLGKKVSYHHDAVGNKTGIIYPDSTTENYSYLKNNWLDKVSSNSFTTNYALDNVGNVTKITNSNNTVSNYAYDKVYRPTSIVNATNSGVVNSSFNYTYNNVGLRTDVKEHYNWRQPEDLNTNYAYDALGRLTESDQTGKRNTKNSYSYDSAGNRVTWISNDDLLTPKPFDKINLAYDYNSANELTRIRDLNEKLKTSTSTKTVTSNGKSNGKTITNKKPIPVVSGEFVDGIEGFLKYLETQKAKHIDTKAYSDLTNQVNALIKTASDGLLTQADANTALDSLKKSINIYVTSKDIGNSGVGNSLTEKLKGVDVATLPIQLQYQTSTSQIAGVSTSSSKKVTTSSQSGLTKYILFNYDANGNRIQMQTFGAKGGSDDLVKYGYDQENNLTNIASYTKAGSWKSNDVTSMQYDGLGRRLITQDKNSKTQFAFNNLDPIAEYDLKNNQYDNLYRGAMNNIVMSQDFPSGSNGQQTWYDYDALNSVVGLTKQDGQSAKNYRYTDFGSVYPENGNFTAPHNDFTFTGQLLDSNNNLYNFYSRTYDPKTGVWLQQDKYRGKIEDPMSLHRYNYVNQSPINFADYKGFDAIFLGQRSALADDAEKLRQIYSNSKDVLVSLPGIVATTITGLVTTTGTVAGVGIIAGSITLGGYQSAVTPQFSKQEGQQIANSILGKGQQQFGNVTYEFQSNGIVMTHTNTVCGQTTIEDLIKQGYFIQGTGANRQIRFKLPTNMLQGGSTSNPNNSNDLNDILRKVAEKIANGHAYDKHIEEFSNINNKSEFAQMIYNIINNSDSLVKQGANGRTAYWDPATGTIVILDPNNTDGGTVFKPDVGISYFNTQFK